jgi:hypothetical protein
MKLSIRLEPEMPLPLASRRSLPSNALAQRQVQVTTHIYVSLQVMH